MRDTQEDGNLCEHSFQNELRAAAMVNNLSRLAARFYSDEAQIEMLHGAIGKKLSARRRLEAGLVTPPLMNLDWEDEIRQAKLMVRKQSPDA